MPPPQPSWRAVMHGGRDSMGRGAEPFLSLGSYRPCFQIACPPARPEQRRHSLVGLQANWHWECPSRPFSS